MIFNSNIWGIIMLSCPKCSHDISIKSGFAKGRQRWKCKGCGYHYTVAHRGASKEQKRQALELYLEGLGFRSIGRFLNFSHVAVYNWIKEFGQKLEEIKSDKKIEIVEIDEMHTYISRKKTTAGSGLLLIELGEGSSTFLLESAIQKQGKYSGNP